MTLTDGQSATIPSDTPVHVVDRGGLEDNVIVRGLEEQLSMIRVQFSERRYD